MDDERITRTVRVKPTVVVGVPLSMKRWLEATARERETSQSAITVEALEQYRARLEAELVELTAVPA